MRPSILRAAAIAATCLALAGGTGPARAEDDDHARGDPDEHGIWTLTIEQAPPTLVSIPAGDEGDVSEGDILAFVADATAEDGRTGTIRGLLITVDVPDATDVLEDRIGHIVFDLGDGDSLVVAGASVYVSGDEEMTPETPQMRAVIGGTGIYIGARGEVETTRHEDGSYTHVITLLHEGGDLFGIDGWE